MKQIKTALRGAQLLTNPLLNKGTAFTAQERDALGLNGLLPAHVSSIEEQIQRSYANFSKKRTPLGKYVYLMSLLNRNEMLFYQFVLRYATEMLPFIYTPTVGEAALQYSQLYSHRRGFYVSYPLEDKIEAMVAALSQKQVDVIVVTDGERILGLGDQGLGGMTIPIGKLSLYTLFAGVHPANVLPVLLDVGTDNPDLLANPLYLGWRHVRMRGNEYDRFVERFIVAIVKRFPNVLLQWEDFGKTNARRLLDRYRRRILSFNDDIQGTAAVVLGALLAAIKATKAKLTDQKIVILGAGSAGTGIAEMLTQAMVREGLNSQDAHRQIYLVDRHGLIHFNTPNVDDSQRPFARTQAELSNWAVKNFEYVSLHEVVANAHPTILIGVSAQTGAFTQEIVEEMHKHVQRPIIFPLSNPTSKSEAIPEELLSWTKGRALIATGSPFQPVVIGQTTHPIAQCNNVFIFPGVGLGALAAQASEVTDGMFLEAAEALAKASPALKDPAASLFPPIGEVRQLSQKIALAVATQAVKDGVAGVKESELERRIAERVWEPEYPSYSA